MLAIRKPSEQEGNRVYRNEVLDVLEIKKGAIKGDSVEYIKKHPELLELLNGFMFNLLLREEKDIYKFAKKYFNEFDLHANYFKPIVISGPSAVGKGTLIRMLLKEFPNIFALSVSYTTRKARPGETHGKDYYFIEKAEFEKMIEENKFVEHCTVHGNLYGTAQEEINRIAREHKICIIEIEVNGAQKISKSAVEANYMFIYPPTVNSLKERILGRGTETQAAIELRMKNALGELDYADNSVLYRYRLVNDDLMLSYNRFKEMMMNTYKEAIKSIPLNS